MGRTKIELSRIKLPDRELHNSRLFIDLCENIHIHYREFRIVFSLDEYFEFVDIVSRSTEDVRSYLAQNPEYEEGIHGDTVMLAGGWERRRKLLANSPKPNESTYFPNDFFIELLEETETDEIHVHWRDYRFAISRGHFKIIADAFTKAKKELKSFEANHDYQRLAHPDRNLNDFKKEWEKYNDYDSRIMGEEDVSIDEIEFNSNGEVSDSKFDINAIDILVEKYEQGKRVSPIILSTEVDNKHLIIDGNQRMLAAKKAELREVNCIVTDLTLHESRLLQEAENLLNRFDRQTEGRYNTSGFMKKFIAERTSRYYKDHFYRLLLSHSNDKFLQLHYINIIDRIKYIIRRWFNKHQKIKLIVKKFI